MRIEKLLITRLITLGHHSPQPQAQQYKFRGSSPIFGRNRGGVWKGDFEGQKIANISETVRYRPKVRTKCGYNLYKLTFHIDC